MRKPERRSKQLEGVSRVVKFIERLKIPSGKGAGGAFKVRGWQRQILSRIYGPTLPDGRRQVRTALVSLPRKNGKTALAAALGLYHLIADGELHGQVICAACDRNQAGLIYNAARAMVEADPELSTMVNVAASTKRLVHLASGSYLTVIAADAGRAHGLSPSLVICDELAQWPKRDLWDALATSTGAREQPLFLMISTQSHDPNNIMSEQIAYARLVLSGAVDDPTFAATIFEADEGEDWQDEAVWHRANPALGDFRSLAEMRTACARAVRVPAQRAAFETFYLNRPQAVEGRWLSGTDWDACAAPVDVKALEGRPCWAGLDLGSTQDLTAVALVFPDRANPPTFDVLAHFWTARETMDERGNRDRVPYRLWSEQGFITATPGRVIDTGAVARWLAKAAQRYDIRGVAFDRWRIEGLQKQLDDAGIRLPLVEFGQGFASMAPAVDRLEAAVLDGRLRHGGNPVLRWNAANAIADTDPAGNRKLTKARAIGRIDGLVALVMAVGLHGTTAGPRASVYEGRAPIFV